MELTKSQERRLAFVASLLSLNPNDPTDRIKALRHLNLDENGCFHGFQYSQGFMEFFIFLDEDTPLEKVVSHLNSDLKQLQIAVFRTSDPPNPFFMSLREEADPWAVNKISDDEDEEDSDSPASRPYMETLEITVLRTRATRDITDSELERTLKDMRRKLGIWKNEVKAKLEIIAEHDDLTRDFRSADDKLEIVMDSDPL
ncbi:MAG: abortive phage resistance protein, partial [Fibrobacter sp.]|nr:abortive phage resistance protein [Fibrobacter sp.]